MLATSRDLQQIAYFHTKLGIPENYATVRGLSAFSEAEELVKFENDLDPRCLYLAPAAKVAWGNMKQAATSEGLTLQAYSGFRSYEYQQTLIQNRLHRGEDIATVLSYLAAPGFSEHHTGFAIDITTSGCTAGCQDFERTSAFEWLVANAGKFSFKMSYPRNNPWGFVYEPWHWAFKE